MLTKQLSRQNNHLKKQNWSEKFKLDLMEKILISKLEQHEEVRQALLKTENRLIIEDSPTDDFWGYYLGTGQNHLGKIWMKLKEKLKNDKVKLRS